VTRGAIPFNRALRTGEEGARIDAALASGWTGGNGPFTAACERLLKARTGASRVLLTHSCTGALEMAALLSGVGPGDEVVLPSFTFVSTANAWVLRGATPVFADVDADTLCLDPARVADAVTPRTRAIVPVHYAGVGADMVALGEIARRAGALLVEDAAQAVGASRQGRALGAIGDLGCLSFHETKNVSCGEGGALLLNHERWIERAEVLQEKGTSRARFSRGEVDRYTWVDVGSSFLMADVTAALLLGQLERVEEITAARLALWERYHAGFAELEAAGVLRRPRVPADAAHNAHLYAVVLEDRAARDRVIASLAGAGIQAYFHYVPLHSSPAGRRYGRVAGPLDVTDRVGETLVRMPLWVGLAEDEVDRVVQEVGRALTGRAHAVG
jgi:dTDP-4-amino-4,6-dideoxygalactose transaminase